MGDAPPASLDIHLGDNLAVAADWPDGGFDLVYLDPPFNTGMAQQRTRTRTVRDDAGDRTGFQGRRYRTETLDAKRYADAFDDYAAFLIPRLELAHRLLSDSGSFFLHLDCREVHYAKVWCDAVFGRDAFVNEIIWAYDYGGRPRKKWPCKHDNLLWYAKDPTHYTYRYDDIDRIPYMAPGLVTKEKAQRGKTPTDVWWHTIVSPTGKEKTGYPTQKPLGILNRIVAVHTNPGDTVLDFFAGSGSMGEAAIRQGRHAVLVDDNPEAMQVMATRFAFTTPRWHGWTPTLSQM